MRLPTFIRDLFGQRQHGSQQYSSARRGEAPQELYKNLKMKPADPNLAKHYAWGLVGAAAFVALLTFRSNFDYFLLYYTGWSLKIRVAVFLGVEAFLILAPLTKGYGNKRQVKHALIFEGVLVPLLFLHTYMVGESLETRKEAETTRSTAQSDLDRERGAAKAVEEANQKARDSFNASQKNHTAAMARHERLVRQAIRNRTAVPRPPVPPSEPQYAPVPKINEGLVNNSTLAVNEVVQNKVDHNTLRALQFLILLAAIAGTTCIVLFSDAMRLREWFMNHRDADLQKTMESHAPYRMLEPPAQPDIVTAQRQPPGFVAPAPTAVQAPAPSYTVNSAPSRSPSSGNLGNP